MWKPCGEAGANLLCQALVREELHPLTVQRRKSLFMLMHEGFQASVSECRRFASPRELILLRASQLTHCTSLHFCLNRKNQGKILVFQFFEDQDFHWFVKKPCVDSL